jgi:hypothetical protein
MDLVVGEVAVVDFMLQRAAGVFGKNSAALDWSKEAVRRAAMWYIILGEVFGGGVVFYSADV